MPVCARAIEQPDGSYLLGLDPTETNVTTCPYVVTTGAESGFASLFDLTPEEASLIAAAIALVWAIAWGFRLLGRHITHEERFNDE